MKFSRKAKCAASVLLLATSGWLATNQRPSEAVSGRFRTDSGTFPVVQQPLPSATSASQRLLQLNAQPAESQDWQSALKSWIARDSAGDRRTEIEEAIVQIPDKMIPRAAAWIESLPPGNSGRSVALNLVLSRWVHTDPNGAISFITALPDSGEKSQLLGSAALRWAGSDPEAATNWANHLPVEIRHEIWPEITTGLAQHSPEEAARWVSDMEAGPSQEVAALDVVSQWAVTDPEAAAAWIASFPPGAVRESALQELLLPWTNRDPSAAHQWLLSQPQEK